jgi:hypothetical protein
MVNLDPLRRQLARHSAREQLILELPETLWPRLSS